MGKIGYTDKPVGSIKNDAFHIETYINGLCSFIRSCDTPMTISIQGDWGSGKTSMMNMIRENLQTNVCSIWFNTWQFSQFDMGNNLVFSMLGVLLKELDMENETVAKLLEGITGFVRKAATVATDMSFGGAASEMVSNVISGNATTNCAEEIILLKEKFQKLVDKKLEKTKKDRLVVFVDDLDRLQPSKAVELLEVLKLFLDCEHCVFVLAVDYEVVTQGIQQKFGENFSVDKGKSFFDKIIQLPFKMPVAQYDITNYVENMLNKMGIEHDGKLLELYVGLIQYSIGFNPRSMKRLFNTYQLLDIISKGSLNNIDDAIRRRILFAIICMQMSYEELYLYFAYSCQGLDATILNTFKSETAMRNAFEEDGDLAEELKINVAANGEIDREKLRKMIQFMQKFSDAIQIDEDEEFSEEEIRNLKSILMYSTITSVNTGSEMQESTGSEWDYRYINKNIVNQVSSILKDVAEFTLWMPRKEREGVKISDACGYKRYRTSEGLEFNLEFYVKRESEIATVLSILLSNKTKKCEEQFLEVFGENPLELSTNPIIYREWGGIEYNNLLRFNSNDSNAAEQIATVVRSAIEKINKYM